MTLSPGTTLGSFEIVGLLGAGGMGEVYRARDTKLGREVAIKVLPEAFAKDKDRLARFEREARLLAALNHPGIAGVHDLQESNGVRFLVMELVDGPTLAERIARHPVPVEEALPLFAQIAEALEKAHEQGIVHRDLKPANIKITGEGKVKILDFGLAKAFESPALSSSSPGGTVAMESDSAGVTGEGKILGTPAYMSPEQARGQAVDKRADIWSFGCCLFEALTGKRPFRGQTASDLLAEILKSEPDWTKLPPDTPGRIRDLLWRCLQKDPRRRLRDIGDAWFEITKSGSDPSGAMPVGATTVERRGVSRTFAAGLAVAGIALGAVVAGWVALRSRPQSPPPPEVRRYSIIVPADRPIAAPFILPDSIMALSRDGKTLAYVSEIEGVRRLVIRRLAEMETEALAGTEGAMHPFFSPDGEWIGFFAGSERKLKKASIRGGGTTEICAASFPLGASWGEDDRIVFASELGRGLMRVSAAGEPIEEITQLDVAAGEAYHVTPEILPGGKAVLFLSATRPGIEATKTILLNLETRERTVLAEAVGRPIYAASGHILYAKAGALFAVPFDVESLKTTGPVALITENRMATPSSIPDQFGLSLGGELVFLPAGQPSTFRRQLVWVGLDGAEELTPVPPGAISLARVSPDGSRVAFSFDDARDIWIQDLTPGSLPQRLTFDSGTNFNPIWSPDGSAVVYLSYDGPDRALKRKAADGTGEAIVLSRTPPSDLYGWIPGSEQILLTFNSRDGLSQDIGSVDPANDYLLTPLLAGKFSEGSPAISADGKWIAYSSNETGRLEIFVRPFPALDGKWQVSTGGGAEPVWAPDGGRIYFRLVGSMFSIDVQTSPQFRTGPPKLLFQGDYINPTPLRRYDLSPDGKRFLMIRQGEPGVVAKGPATEFIVVENWFEELKRLAPPAKSPEIR